MERSWPFGRSTVRVAVVFATAALVGGAAILGVPWRLQAESIALTSSAVDAGHPFCPDAAGVNSRPAFQQKRTTDQFSADWKNGDEVFAIDPKLIAHIDFETEEKAIVVGRTEGSHNRFDMTVTTRATGKVEHCKADALMRALLPALSSIRVRRAFAPAAAEVLWARQGQRSAILRIADTLDVDPKVFQVLLNDVSGSSADTSIVLREESHLFVPSVKADTVQRLSAGCTTPAPARRP